MSAIKGLSLAVLRTGRMEKDKSQDFAMFNWGDNINRQKPAVWWSVPNHSFLIRHPQAGYILVDGGARRGCQYGGGMRDPATERYNPLYVESGQWIDEQLSLCGISVKDLSAVVITNYFWYKVGVLELLAGTKAAEHIYVPKADFGYAAVETHKSGADAGLHYMRRDFDMPGLTFTYIDERTRIAPGVELLALAGNTPATLCVLVEAESGCRLLPGYAVPTAENLAPLRVTMAYDSVAFLKTVKELSRIRDQYEAQLLYAHDPDQEGNMTFAPRFF